MCIRDRLRGEQLRVRVRLVILDLAQKAAEAGKKYIYSASEVARLVPTTRKTLGRICLLYTSRCV